MLVQHPTGKWELQKTALFISKVMPREKRRRGTEAAGASWGARFLRSRKTTSACSAAHWKSGARRTRGEKVWGMSNVTVALRIGVEVGGKRRSGPGLWGARQEAAPIHDRERHDEEQRAGGT